MARNNTAFVLAAGFAAVIIVLLYNGTTLNGRAPIRPYESQQGMVGGPSPAAAGPAGQLAADQQTGGGRGAGNGNGLFDSVTGREPMDVYTPAGQTASPPVVMVPSRVGGGSPSSIPPAAGYTAPSGYGATGATGTVPATVSTSLTDGAPRSAKTFEQVARSQALVSDKVSHHQYQFAYDEYLEPYRHLPVVFVEVGFGCGSKHGEGASVGLWAEYFTHPNAVLVIMELDAGCIRKYVNSEGYLEAHGRKVHLVIGDQANPDHWRRVVDKFGKFDVVVDDGSHWWRHQRVTAGIVMKDVLKPGGLLIIEDLLTSFPPYTAEKYGGGSNSPASNFLLNLSEWLMFDKHRGKGLSPPTDPDAAAVAPYTMWLSCVYSEICVLKKWYSPPPPPPTFQ